jgi:hypothetical protein
MKAIDSYLDRQMVPRRLIDRSMSHPSNDMYWLTTADLNEIGELPAQHEEFLIQRCGYDRHHARQLAEMMERSEQQSDIDSFISRGEAVDRCVVDALAKEREKGIREVRRGWRPSK